ncbi:MAG TPA: VTT domain-containing protein [Desulfitobacteriaceae bacterium]|nr:VTT domain-containing protein [Desulfitobacteriaceae bacterium]
MIRQKIKEKNYSRLTLITIMFFALIVLFFYFDRQNELSHLIRAWGLSGILLSIFLIALLCMTPIPSEGLLILLFKIFGVYEGALYAWLGSILGSLANFYLARYFGQIFFEKLITPRRLHMVDHWISKNGPLGLMITGLSPIPPIAIAYIAGVMPSVKPWTLIWTAALSIIPYYVGAALVYVGVSKSTWIWVAVGGVTILTLWGIGYTLFKKANNTLQ